MPEPVYMVPDASIASACKGRYAGIVYVVVDWEKYHEVMGHDGYPYACDECRELFVQQFRQDE